MIQYRGEGMQLDSHMTSIGTVTSSYIYFFCRLLTKNEDGEDTNKEQTKMGHGGHLGLQMDTPDTISKLDHPRTIVSKFGCHWH
jgi:hypothetical protein